MDRKYYPTDTMVLMSYIPALFWRRWKKLVFIVIVACIFGLNVSLRDGLHLNQILASKSKNRNILLLIADNYGLDAGCYCNPVLKTPNIDKLAEEGILFTNAFATVASCSPCRSVIYTGLFNHTNGQFGLSHNPYDCDTHDWVKSMPSLLNEKGYHTGIIGKFHVKPWEVYNFDEVIEWDKSGYTLTRKVKDFLSSDTDNPFLLVVGFYDPASWHNNRDKEALKKQRYPGIKRISYSPEDVIVPPVLPDELEVREEIALYYRSVSRMDQYIGRVLEVLKESGRYKETMIIFLGDGGPAFPGMAYDIYDTSIRQPLIICKPDLEKKGSINNAMVSYIDLLPTVLHWTGQEPPYRIYSPGYKHGEIKIRYLDFPERKDYYTLPGRSILPILEEENPEGWDTVYASHSYHSSTLYYPMRSIRTRNYKYILNMAYKLDFPVACDIFNMNTWKVIEGSASKNMGVRNLNSYLQRPEEELYNIKNDPYETNNLLDDPAHKHLLENLRKRLEKFQERTEDIWLLRFKY
jgi:N-sulfoglucosamine sulfohydrolase